MAALAINLNPRIKLLVLTPFYPDRLRMRACGLTQIAYAIISAVMIYVVKFSRWPSTKHMEKPGGERDIPGDQFRSRPRNVTCLV